MATINLYCFQKLSNVPHPSGFCQKLETFLRATNFTSYTETYTLPHRAPKGKLPYIILSTPSSSSSSTPKIETIADTGFIIRHLVKNGIVEDLDKALTPRQKAESKAFITWTEELYYPALVQTQWARDKNYAATAADVTKTLPPVIGGLICWYLRRNIINMLWMHGVGRHSNSEIDTMLQEYADALSARLEENGGGEFFHGQTPTLVDVVLYGFMANALNEPGNPEYRGMVLKGERLKRYVAVCTKLWFPEYEGLLETVA